MPCYSCASMCVCHPYSSPGLFVSDLPPPSPQLRLSVLLPRTSHVVATSCKLNCGVVHVTRFSPLFSFRYFLSSLSFTPTSSVQSVSNWSLTHSLQVNQAVTVMLRSIRRRLYGTAGPVEEGETAGKPKEKDDSESNSNAVEEPVQSSSSALVPHQPASQNNTANTLLASLPGILLLQSLKRSLSPTPSVGADSETSPKSPLLSSDLTQTNSVNIGPNRGAQTPSPKSAWQSRTTIESKYKHKSKISTPPLSCCSQEIADDPCRLSLGGSPRREYLIFELNSRPSVPFTSSKGWLLSN